MKHNRLGGNADRSSVAAYFEAALDTELSAEDSESLADCPLVSVCGVICKEAIDAARILLESVRRHVGRDTSYEHWVVSTALHLCQVVYVG